MAFVKGQSGNPGGRTAKDVELRRLARTHARRALAVQLRLLKSADERVRMAASEAILNRGYGKADQSVHMTGQLEHRHTNEMSRDELLAIAAGGRAGVVEAGSGEPEPSGLH